MGRPRRAGAGAGRCRAGRGRTGHGRGDGAHVRAQDRHRRAHRAHGRRGALPPQRRAARDRASSRELCDQAAARGGGGRGRRLCRCRRTCIFARAAHPPARRRHDRCAAAPRQPRQCTPEQGADHRRGQGARGPKRAPPRPEPAGAQRSRVCGDIAALARHIAGAHAGAEAARACRLHRRGAGRSHARAARTPRRHDVRSWRGHGRRLRCACGRAARRHRRL